ncbi:DUF3391 domain-containing protein, partial [Arthrospira platensis SPKY1]|nr:DUF3391 domain-containing protein [Arthrospira platensis SPKY1]
MLKKIPVSDLRLGMFIQAFDGSWMDHPFWRNRFVLESPDDLDKVRASAVKAVWIDVGRGLDVPAASPAVEQVDTEDEVEAALLEDRLVFRSVAPCTMDTEVARAAAICNSARRAVTSMFSD